MSTDGWENNVACSHDWKLWNCRNVRQLIMPWDHGYLCGCGVRVIGVVDAVQHNIGKGHNKWLRWMRAFGGKNCARLRAFGDKLRLGRSQLAWPSCWDLANFSH